MITVLLGQDVLTKQAYIDEQLRTGGGQLQKIRSGDKLPDLASLGEPTLFGPAFVYAFEYCWKDVDPETLLEQCAQSAAHIFIIEDNIDQRKTINKTFLRDKRVTVKEFEAPNGLAAAKWIKQHAAALQISITQEAATALASALAPSETDKLSVLAAHNELLKLHWYADQKDITAAMVSDLVMPTHAIDAFGLLDAVASHNKSQALLQLDQFFAHTSGDDKAKAIQFSALLADQLRNILLVQDADVRKVPESEIIEKTGWKSGRVFVMRKMARHFKPRQIKETLAKLENLDMELKSSTLPPHVVLDVIISQM